MTARLPLARARRWVVSVLLVASGAVAPGPARLAAAAPPFPFTTTFWCGPPLAEFTDARAAEIAAAGFTTVGPPCEGTDRDGNLRALDVAARHGLLVWVKDPRLEPNALDNPEWQSALARAAADYRDHPALGGYFIDDEPVTTDFAHLAPLVDALRAADPAHLAYINLLPDYASPTGPDAVAYDEYVERFMSTVRPSLLSYDYYPFRKDNDRSTFFANLRIIREAALRHQRPFILIVLAMPHGPYRDPTEAELAWQAFHALAFGARGISYFAYWTPSDDDKMNFRYGLVEAGRPTLHYFQVARLNQAVRAIGQQLAPLQSFAVADSAGEVGQPFPIGPIEAVDGGAITVGLFVGESNELAALLVNRDYRYGATATLRLRSGQHPPEAFDVATGRWQKADASPAFRLAPGGAQLVRWRPAS
jgi:hypothetical protein